MANEALRLIGTGADAPPSATGEEVNLREVWRGLKRRKLALLAPVLLITLGVFLWVKQQPPMYTAEALLHVQESRCAGGRDGGLGRGSGGRSGDHRERDQVHGLASLHPAGGRQAGLGAGSRVCAVADRAGTKLVRPDGRGAQSAPLCARGLVGDAGIRVCRASNRPGGAPDEPGDRQRRQTADGRPGGALLRDLPDVPVRGSGQERPHR